MTKILSNRCSSNQKSRWLAKLWMIPFLLMILAQVGFAQEKRQITLNLKNVKRSELVKLLGKQTGMNFIYNSEELDNNPKISINVKNKSLEFVLDQVVAGSNMFYVTDKNVVIFKVKAPGGQISPTGSGVTIEAAKIHLRGKVTDQSGQAMPGVVVEELTKQNRTSTDVNGNYNLFISQSTAIRYAYIGMKPEIINLNLTGKDVVVQNILLKEDIKGLDDVVITGYQRMNKKDVAGSVSSVKLDDIKIGGINTVDQLIQGQIPGVAVSNPSGLVGVKTKVRTRGTSTLLGSQDPVWVVDGIIQNELIPFQYQEFNAQASEGNTDALKNLIGNTVSFLNVEDIEDITVLKDASATAIYGVKAANGVIVITTKRGKVGPTRVNYNTTFTVAERPSYDRFNLMNSKDRINVSKEIYEKGLQFQNPPDQVSYEGLLTKLFNNKINQDQFAQGVNKMEMMNTDWFGLLYQSPMSTAHTVSLSGGSNQTSFYASVGASSDQGVSIGNNQNRYNGTIKLNTNFNDKLSVAFDLAASMSTTKGYYKFDPFSYAYNTSRAIPELNDDGSRFFYVNNNSIGSFSSATYKFNVLNDRDYTGATNKVSAVSAGFNLQYKFNKDLTFQSLANYSMSQTKGESYAADRSSYITSKRGYEFGSVLPLSTAYLRSPLPMGGVLNEMNMINKSYTFRNTINYSRNLRQNDNIVAMAGVEVRSSIYDGHSISNYGYMPDRGRTFAMPPLTTTSSGFTDPNTSIYNEMIPTVTDRVSNYLSYFGTVAYNLEQKYIINASIRSDASNRFGDAVNRHRFLPVWSAGFKWNIAEENLFKNMDWLNQLSFRASYGFQGNVAENFSPDLVAQIPTGSAAVSPMTGEAILKIKSLAYADLRWEKSNTVNFGLDFMILKNRISGTVEYYNKKTTDAIMQIPIPTEYGMISMPINGGNLVNRGYEISLNFVPVQLKDLRWSMRFNTGKNYNRIDQSKAVSPSLAANWNVASSGTLYKEGYPISGFWAFDYAGLDPVTGRPKFDKLAKDDPNKATDATLGMVYVGQLDPKFTGGFSNTIQYKRLTLTAFFNAAFGHRKFLPPLYKGMLNSAPYPALNLSNEINGRWRNPGDEVNTNIPGLPTANTPTVALPFGASGSTISPYLAYDNSDIRVVDASFVRCKNISLMYNMSEKLLKHIGFVRSCTIQGNATNLFYIASKKLNGVDPEVLGNSLPLPRSFSLGLNVGL